MNIILLLLLTLSTVHASLREFKDRFDRHVNIVPHSYEFSIGTEERPTKVINSISGAQGLEALSYEKMISPKELDQFVEKLFDSSRYAPYYCHNLVGEIADFKAYLSQCKKITTHLLSALKDDSLEINFFHFEGSNSIEGDFKKAKLQAIDANTQESVVLNIDISIQNRPL